MCANRRCGIVMKSGCRWTSIWNFPFLEAHAPWSGEGNVTPHVRPVLPGGRNSGQKAQKGPQKEKKLVERICGRILAEFYQKVAVKGPQKIFNRSSLFLAMITTYNVPQDEIKFDF
jgi:hypothetical protein